MKTAIFIDGSSLYGATNRLGFKVDYKKLYEMHGGGGDDAVFHYQGLAMLDTEGFSSVRKLHDWLSFNGYRVTEHVVDADKSGSSRDPLKRIRACVLVGLALAMADAARGGVDRVTLYAGDESLVPAVEALQRAGAHVTIAYDHEACAEDMRAHADRFVDLMTLRDQGILQPKPIVA